jgi:hypothetical protein
VVTAHLSDVQILACTLYGEARSWPTEDILAFGCVIRNRVQAGTFGTGYREVCLQYPVWADAPKRAKGDLTNHGRLAQLVDDLATGEVTDPRYRECAWLATGLVNHWVRDTVHGANASHAAALTPRPDWALGWNPINHLFTPRAGQVFYKIEAR